MRFIFLCFLFISLLVKAQSGFDKKINETAKSIICPQPDERNPVTLNVQSVSEGDSIAVIIKVSIAPGWHIYEYVPASLPYIAIDRILQLPENIKAIGNWKKTQAETSSDDPGVLIYNNKAIFIHKAVKLSYSGTNGIIKAGLYYQTCNLRQCLPPKEKTFDLRY